MSKPTTLPDQLELLVADANGLPRGKTMEGAAYDENDLPHLAEAVFFHSVTGAYADTIEIYDSNDRDLLLEADWTTFRPTPWKRGDVGQVVCRTLNQLGEPIAYDPRNVLQRVIDAYEEMGLNPVVAPEAELYLLEPLTRGDLALTPAAGAGGAIEVGGESFSPDALDKYSAVMDDVYRMSAEMHMDLAGVVHEMGPAQVEFNVAHGDAMSRADQLFQLKRLIKGCAQRHGLLASFMAKPMAGKPGNGLHVHCSVVDDAGKNIFALRRGLIPPPLRHFIGGLQKYLPEAFALIAPHVNSYKRFVRDLSAPVNLSWGYDNRTTGLRVPFSQPAAGRVENRVAGADANPYLVIAATLVCGLMGLQEEVSPSKSAGGDASELDTSFPRDLAEALRVLERSTPLRRALGDAFVDVFVSVKRAELAHYEKEITRWEVSYLGSVL